MQAGYEGRLRDTALYRVRHHTRFRYGAPIVESFMEVRMQPVSSGQQRCHTFSLSTTPGAMVLHYEDFQGNIVNHFSIPSQHTQLTIKAEAVVEKQLPDPLPDSLTSESWLAIDALCQSGRYWDYLGDSRFARHTPALTKFAGEIELDRSMDPLTLLRQLNKVIHETFGYMPNSTRVDSPIDEALEARQGVCQDFSHITIALVRGIGIPCRYVSGYLYHQPDEDRAMDDTSHAWVEAMLPGHGWVGFDPTNNLLAAERHIRVAVGRDYADVPPTRGVFRGDVETELDVGVQVSRLDDQTAANLALLPNMTWDPSPDETYDKYSQQQQQQQ